MPKFIHLLPVHLLESITLYWIAAITFPVHCGSTNIAAVSYLGSPHKCNPFGSKSHL